MHQLAVGRGQQLQTTAGRFDSPGRPEGSTSGALRSPACWWRRSAKWLEVSTQERTIFARIVSRQPWISSERVFFAKFALEVGRWRNETVAKTRRHQEHLDHWVRPIVIGQGCEFDYSGTQACKSLREEGYRVVLVNSNPATIMTDPGFSDRTYIEPISVGGVRKVLELEQNEAHPLMLCFLPWVGKPH